MAVANTLKQLLQNPSLSPQTRQLVAQSLAAFGGIAPQQQQVAQKRREPNVRVLPFKSFAQERQEEEILRNERLKNERLVAAQREKERAGRTAEERAARIKELGFEGYQEYSKEGAPAGKRRFLEEFRAKKKQAAIDKQALEQQHALELEEYKIQGRARLKFLDRELTFEDRVRKVRHDELLNRLHQAQTDKLLDAPQFEKYKSNLRLIEEGFKAKTRMKQDAYKQSLKYTEKAVELEQKKDLAEFKAKLQPPKESNMQEYMRMRNTGNFKTVRDIAAFWASKGRHGDQLRETVLLSAAQMGLSPEAVSRLDFRFNPFTDSPTEKYENFLNTLLPGTTANQLGSKVLEKYGNRAAAEQALKHAENQARRRAYEAGEPVDEDLIKEISLGMDAFNRKWPDQPSIYHTLDTFTPMAEATSERTLNQMNKQIGDLLQAGQEGSVPAIDELNSIQAEIDSFLKQNEKRKKQMEAEERKKKFYREAQ